MCDHAPDAAPATLPPKWAAQILKLRVEQRMKGDAEALAVLHGEHMLGWHTDLKHFDRTSMAFHARRLDNDRPFMSECVVCRFAPAGADTTVWWNPCYALQEFPVFGISRAPCCKAHGPFCRFSRSVTCDMWVVVDVGGHAPVTCGNTCF